MKLCFFVAAVFFAFLGVASARDAAPSRTPVQDLRGAAFAIAAQNELTLDQARTELVFSPAASFAFPGVASPLHPLQLWVRLTPQAAWRNGSWYIVAAPAVGRAEFFYTPAGSKAYASIRFGMRVPFSQRGIARVQPTIQLPAADPSAPLYLRLSLDDESHVVPLIAVFDGSALRQEDDAMARLASIALLFIGIFISLAAANIFVFGFVREAPYLVYSGMMLSNALFAAMYLHESAWKWLWPGASLPDILAQGCGIILEAIFLLAFARTFLDTARLVPRLDRAVLWICSALIVLSLVIVTGAGSVSLGPLTGRDIFIIATLAFVVAVFILGIGALRAGSIPARFFVASNAAVSISAAILAISNLSAHEVTQSTQFVALMTGQAVEGWLLFGALAFRLQQAIRAHIDEQQRRIVAQAESLAQAHALLEQRQVASTDPLTGIANRRAFDESLAREWDRCARAGAPFSLLMFDVDHFKAFNDTYGHVLGDDCLRKVAGAIASCATRPTDLCARYGGEEFAMILPETDCGGALEIAAQSARAVRALALTHSASSLGNVTVSIGVATVLPVGGAKLSIVELADRELYRAKEGGRNRYAWAGGIDEESAQALRTQAVTVRAFPS